CHPGARRGAAALRRAGGGGSAGARTRKDFREMGVAEVQAALARLYVEPELCERLRKDPHDLCREMGLDGSDAEQVRSLAVDQVEAFARSLRNKRLGEVRTLLPRTSRAL